jgi:very-short-patch-repair endonuclease
MTSNTTVLAKNLRKRATDAERLLWKYLRIKQLENLKFKRQQPIGTYIVDFVCFEKRIVIEVDGGQHSASENDAMRDAWLSSQGFKVLRFWNHEVLTNIEGVLEVIRRSCIHSSPNSPSPTPPLQGGATTNNGETRAQ